MESINIIVARSVERYQSRLSESIQSLVAESRDAFCGMTKSGRSLEQLRDEVEDLKSILWKCLLLSGKYEVQL